MAKEHAYAVRVTWTGNTGQGTSGYRAYDRSHDIAAAGKPTLAGSADPAFRGDAACWNPEDMLVASLSACHMLWYLHLCAVSGVVVTGYEDRAEGLMTQRDDGGGYFVRVTLRPVVTLAPGSDPATARALHAAAHDRCFIANSMNFPVAHEAEIVFGEPG